MYYQLTKRSVVANWLYVVQILDEVRPRYQNTALNLICVPMIHSPGHFSYGGTT